MKILVLNGGSSSVKYWFADLAGEPLPLDPPQPLWEVRVDWGRGPGAAEVRVRTLRGETTEERPYGSSPLEVLQPVLESLWSGQNRVIESPEQIDAAGHRVVHGGKEFRESTLVTAEVRAAIARQAEFAPAHNHFELEAIEMVDRVLGARVPQVAVFDTGFHSTLEPAAYVYPGPYDWLERGVRRYGFHGISHRYASRRAAQILGRSPESLRLITCHLGNGCSLAAVRGGKSVDTTMGFTPLDGLAMGSRCGSVDPGIIIYLLRHCGYAADQLDHILNRESGLLGVSGISGDMRAIQQAMAQGDPRARLAFEVYAHRLTRETGAMLAVLGGLDALVFTGGVGENCAALRALVCRQFGFLRLRLDEEKNAESPADQDIAVPDSAVRVLVIRAQEDWEIARECYRVATQGERAWRESSG